MRVQAFLTSVCIAASAAANAADIPGDLGAGPVAMRITSCLLAAKAHQGTPCKEPQVRDDGTAAEQVDDRLARARYFIDLEDLPAAMVETDAAIAADPNAAAAHHLAARLALTMFDKARAEREIAKSWKPASLPCGRYRMQAATWPLASSVNRCQLCRSAACTWRPSASSNDV